MARKVIIIGRHILRFIKTLPPISSKALLITFSEKLEFPIPFLQFLHHSLLPFKMLCKNSTRQLWMNSITTCLLFRVINLKQAQYLSTSISSTPKPRCSMPTKIISPSKLLTLYNKKVQKEHFLNLSIVIWTQPSIKPRKVILKPFFRPTPTSRHSLWLQVIRH